MIQLEDIVTKLNQTVHALGDDFDKDEMTRLFLDIQSQYQIKYGLDLLTDYYTMKIGQVLEKKSASLKKHDFESAAWYRDLERRYMELIRQTKDDTLRYKSKFFLEGDQIIYCYQHRNKKTLTIIGIIEKLIG